MSETKHSPLPWHTGGIFNPTSTHPTMNIWTEPLPGNSSGDIVAERVPLNDAAFIVLATSLHHELVAALELARQTFRDRGIPDEVIPITLGRINAALQKAKQGDKQ